MTVIAPVNNKGGVGKTTLTAHLAVYFASRGLRVICADVDTQANLTSLLLGGQESAGMYNMLVDRKMPPIETLIQTVTYGGQKFGLLAGEEYQDAMGMLAMGSRLNLVTERLKIVSGYADVMLLDMPPSKALGFRQLLAAADWLLIPTIMERLSIEGVAKIMEVSAEMGIRLMGIVPNKVRRVREHVEQGRELMAVLQRMKRADLLWPPIPETIRIADAQAVGQTIFEYEPGNPASVQLEEIGARALQILRGNGK